MHGIVNPIWCLQTSPRIKQFHQDAIFILTADTENAKKLKKNKIKNTVHKQKCQNTGGVHVRELFTVAEVWNLLRLKLKYQLGSQPKLGHKRNASKSAQEMSRGPAEPEPVLLWLFLPSWRSSRERKALGREWEQLKGASVIAVHCSANAPLAVMPRGAEALTVAGRKFVADLMSTLQLLWVARLSECLRISGEYCSRCELVLLHWLWQFHGGTDWMMTWFAGSALRTA